LILVLVLVFTMEDQQRKEKKKKVRPQGLTNVDDTQPVVEASSGVPPTESHTEVLQELVHDTSQISIVDKNQSDSHEQDDSKSQTSDHANPDTNANTTTTTTTTAGSTNASTSANVNANTNTNANANMPTNLIPSAAPLMSPRVPRSTSTLKTRLRGSDTCPCAKVKLDALLFQWLLTKEPRLIIEALNAESADTAAPVIQELSRERSMGRRSPSTARSNAPQQQLQQHTNIVPSSPRSNMTGGRDLLYGSKDDLLSSPPTREQPAPLSAAAAVASGLNSVYSSSNTTSIYGPGSPVSRFINFTLAQGSLTMMSDELPLQRTQSPPNMVTSDANTLTLESTLLEEAMNFRTLSRVQSSHQVPRRTMSRATSRMGMRRTVSERKRQSLQVPRFYFPVAEGNLEQEKAEYEVLSDYFGPTIAPPVRSSQRRMQNMLSDSGHRPRNRGSDGSNMEEDVVIVAVPDIDDDDDHEQGTTSGSHRRSSGSGPLNSLAAAVAAAHSSSRDLDPFEEDAMEVVVDEIQRTEVNRADFAEIVVEVFGLPSFFSTVLFDRIFAAHPSVYIEANSATQVESGANSKRGSGAPDSSRDRRSGTRSTESHAGEGNGLKSKSSEASEASVSSPPIPVPPQDQTLTRDQVLGFYRKECKGRSRPARLFYLLLDGAKRDYLIPSDFYELVESLLLCHPGLSFLQSTPEFQQRYAETVVQRIFYLLGDRPDSKILLKDFIRHAFLETLMELDEDEDINRERKFFSYEHFYVLYCRFWELDQDHDLMINREDLLRYNGHSLTCRIVDMIFEGKGRPLDCNQAGFMGYTDFVWFCLSEEDKSNTTSIEYWFRCVDLDGDGVITLQELEFFYSEQLHRMECLGHESVKFVDIVCQLLDMIKPKFDRPMIRLRDLKQSGIAGQFFNVLFNLNKFFASESRDPIQIQQERATPNLTAWDRFAALEYLRLSEEEEGDAAEEGGEEGSGDDGDWDPMDEQELLSSDSEHSGRLRRPANASANAMDESAPFSPTMNIISSVISPREAESEMAA